jgi:hypothetical protein
MPTSNPLTTIGVGQSLSFPRKGGPSQTLVL